MVGGRAVGCLILVNIGPTLAEAQLNKAPTSIQQFGGYLVLCVLRMSTVPLEDYCEEVGSSIIDPLDEVVIFLYNGIQIAPGAWSWVACVCCCMTCGHCD